MIDLSLLQVQDEFKEALQHLKAQSVLKRIWDHDHTVWSPDPAEITNRLGWLDIPVFMSQALTKLEAVSKSLRDEDIKTVILLGMGGSSLAPDVFHRVFGSKDGYPLLKILDTTHPDAIWKVRSGLDMKKTVFIVATKSGTTVETLSLFRYFYNETCEVVGDADAGDHFIAITDPDSPLIDLAERLAFREIFQNDPNIGGRYSALSYFGMLPAALIGVDVDGLLGQALQMREASRPDGELIEKDGVVLGTLLGTMANLGRDKLTFLISEKIAPIGDWIEQLIAESTGKMGKGILPVIGERAAEPGTYASNRLFVHIRWQDDDVYLKEVESLSSAGHPVINIEVNKLDEFGALFFLWELAIAIAGHWLGINPFDQPNVESAKKRAKEMVAAYKESGQLPSEEPLIEDEHVSLYAGAGGAASQVDLKNSKSVGHAINSFLRSGNSRGYLSIQAYLPPSEALMQQLRTLQSRIRDVTGLPATVGYGPRYLHSTGQLHKGDSGDGLFLQLTDDKKARIQIPDQARSDGSSLTFGTLIDAQALGDRKALLDAGRSVVRIELKEDPVKSVGRIIDFI
jgi:glucose-6-phosphate isomerase